MKNPLRLSYPGLPGSLLLKARRFLQYKFTVMIVPHNTLRRVHFQFTFSFAFIAFFASAALFSWATFVVMSNVDYWSMKTNHEILKLKVNYFARELRKSQEMLEHVREADLQLRQLLGMKNRQAIIEGEKGQGGPETHDASVLQKVLSKRLWEISDSEIRMQSKAIQMRSLERLQSFKEISEHIAFERGLYRCTPIGWPSEGRYTSHFGQRLSPFHGGPQFHTGIDIANHKGTPVRATADGVVQFADWEGGYGRLVVVDHSFGYATYYGHNSVLKVKEGESVRRGQTIALMGSTGSSTGDHTHYEVWLNGRAVDPWRFLVAQSIDQLRARVRPRLARARPAQAAPAAQP